MDGPNPVSPESGASSASSQPASGSRMSMRDAIRTAVTSQPEFSGKGSSPTGAEPTPDDTIGSDGKAKPAADGGDTAAYLDADEADGGADLKTGAQPAPTSEKATPLSAGEQGSGDAAKAALPEAPARWPAEERAVFAKLPVDAQRILLAREQRFNSAYTQATQHLADTRKSLEHLTSAFTPQLRSQMQGAGLDERGAIDYLVRYHQMYETNPVAYVQAAIQAKGLSPQQIFPDLAGGQGKTQQADAEAGEGEWVDPYVAKVTQKYDTQLGEMQRQLQSLIQSHQTQTQAQRQQVAESLETVVSEFADAADESGQPRYPHLGQVFDHMLYLMKADPQIQQIPLTRAREKLEAAYEMAVYRLPETRQALIDREVEQRLQASRASAQAESQRREQAQAAERAKRASVARPSPGANAPDMRPASTSIKEAARRAVSEHYR